MNHAVSSPRRPYLLQHTAAPRDTLLVAAHTIGGVLLLAFLAVFFYRRKSRSNQDANGGVDSEPLINPAIVGEVAGGVSVVAAAQDLGSELEANGLGHLKLGLQTAGVVTLEDLEYVDTATVDTLPFKNRIERKKFEKMRASAIAV